MPFRVFDVLFSWIGTVVANSHGKSYAWHNVTLLKGGWGQVKCTKGHKTWLTSIPQTFKPWVIVLHERGSHLGVRAVLGNGLEMAENIGNHRDFGIKGGERWTSKARARRRHIHCRRVQAATFILFSLKNENWRGKKSNIFDINSDTKIAREWEMKRRLPWLSTK